MQWPPPWRVLCEDSSPGEEEEEEEEGAQERKYKK